MWPKFELVVDFTPVLVICKFDDGPIKNKVVIVSTFSPLQVYWKKISAQGHVTEANNPLWHGMELVQDFMPVHVICKFEEDPIKTEGAIVSTTFFSSAQRQVIPKSVDECVRNLNSFVNLWLPVLLPASLMAI